MSTPTIDVIIPLYNVERYIGRAIASVLGQTLLPRRILVVDDGSTDGSASVVDGIKASTTSVEIIRLYKPNGGLSAARNHGIAHSDAEFIALLDADDAWAPRKLELQLACMQRPGAEPTVMVYTASHIIDEEDRTIAGTSTLGRPALRGRIFEQLLAANRITGSASAVLIRREVLARTGVFDTALGALEDIDLWLRIAQAGPIDVVEADLTALRRHSSNMQKDTVHMLRNMLVFYTKWFPQAQGRPEVLKEWSHLIAEFALRAKDPRAARQLALSMLGAERSKALFARTFGSLGLYMWLKRWRKRIQPSAR